MLRKATRYGMKIVIGGWHARWHQSPAINRQNHRQHSPGMFGSLDRVQRTQFDGPSGGLCRLLSWNATHLALDKDCPQPRAARPIEAGPIVSIPELWSAPSLGA